MTKELKKRIITSIILFIAAVLLILINKVVFAFAIFIVFFVCFHEWNNINYKYFKKNKRKLKFIYIQLLGLVYFLFFLISAVTIRMGFENGGIFLIFILCICISSDIGGYIFGKTIGGKKLIKISPNKTIAGSVGSFIFSIIPIFLFNFQNFINFDFNLSLKNISFCLIISLSCQIGDLIISYFKRLNKVKDTGSILPGHGGLLDRIDGIIFAVPIASILKLLQIF